MQPDMKPELDWGATINRIRELWPKFEANATQLAVWASQLKHWNQVWVREAIDDVYARDSYATPAKLLPLILERFQSVRQSKSSISALTNTDSVRTADERAADIADHKAVQAKFVDVIRGHMKRDRRYVLAVAEARRKQQGGLAPIYSDDPARWSIWLRSFVAVTLMKGQKPEDVPQEQKSIEQVRTAEDIRRELAEAAEKQITHAEPQEAAA